MKERFLRFAAVILALCLCMSLVSCSTDPAEGEDSSYASGQAELPSSEEPEPLLPPDESASALPAGGEDAESGAVSIAPAGTTKDGQDPTAAPTPDEPVETESRTVRVTIPEGYNIIQVAKKLEANGVCSAEDFINTAQTYDFSYYPLVGSIPSRQYRAFKLEGYLFPDTYEFYKNMKPQDAVGKFLRGGKAVLGSYPTSTAQLKNMDEILTLASIVEKEAKTNTEKNLVAGIFLNRLKQGMKLESDATRDYCINYLDPNTGKYDKLAGPYMEYAYVYNTYNGSTCPGLPAGPICNPGRSSIRAVLNPTKTDALYFCYGADNKLYTATTYEAHQQNLKLAGLA